MRLTKSQWTHHVGAWRSSESTAKEYCSRTGLKLSSFRYWSGRIRKESAEALNEAFGETAAPRFAKVRRKKAEPSTERAPAKPSSSKGLQLTVGEVRVDVPSDFDEGTLRRVLEVLVSTGAGR